MKRNKLKVLSILALSGLAIAGLTACTVNVNTDPTPGQTTTTAVPTTTATPTATTATPTTIHTTPPWLSQTHLHNINKPSVPTLLQ